MPTFIPKPGETHEIDLRDLSDHPLLASIPTWPRDSAEFGGLLESIRDHGLDYDLLATTGFEIIDGRNRRNALVILGGQPGCRPSHVRVRFVSPSDAASIVVASLANRRHLSQGAIAYLCAPMYDAVLAESKARRISNLRRNGELRGDVVPESALGALSAKNAEELAAQMGVSRRLYMQALQLQKLFTKAGKEWRDKLEPRLLGPWQDETGEWREPVGLGYMINGVNAVIDGKKIEESLEKRNDHDRLFRQNLGKICLHWDQATPEQRAAIKGQLFDDLISWPTELVGELAAAAKRVATQQAKQTVGA